MSKILVPFITVEILQRQISQLTNLNVFTIHIYQKQYFERRCRISVCHNRKYNTAFGLKSFIYLHIINSGSIRSSVNTILRKILNL